MADLPETLQAVLDASDEQHFALDRGGRYLAFNRAHAAEMRSLYGVEIAAGDRQTDHAISAADREAALTAHERALAGEHFLIEIVLGPEGRQRTYQLLHTPQTDPGGAIMGLVVSARDVTAQRGAEGRRRESEAMRDASEHVARVASFRWDFTAPRAAWSTEVYALLDMTSGDFGGNVMRALDARVHPEDREALQRDLDGVAESGALAPLDFRVVHRDGSEHILHSEGTAERDVEGRVIALVGYLQDVTEWRRAEAALRESEELHRSILRASPDDITVADLEGRILVVSPAATIMFGHEREEEFHGRSLHEFVVPEDRGHALERIARLLKGVPSGPEQYVGLRADGTTLPLEVHGAIIRDADGRPARMLLVIRDITERKRTEEELARLNEALVDEAAALAEANATIARIAATDDLTGLANRRHFGEALKTAVSFARRHGSPLSLVSIDLDGLKRVNDTAGHEAGDHVLASFAALLAALCRAEDLPARLGGDEFSVLLPGMELDGARGLAERVVAAARSSADLAKRRVTVSAGIAAWEPGASPNELLRRADAALYAVKRGGGDAVAARA